MKKKTKKIIAEEKQARERTTEKLLECQNLVLFDDNHFNVNKDVHQKTLVYIGDIFVYDAGDDDAQDVEEDANNKETPSYSISSLKLAPTTKEVIVETLE
ncbi:hypothetical protein DEO72_LG2g3982 [Vigna unguiculata]|uniref:Uncharacterized protein n=1 Tax=Vigna unguiculata TaxID=3917 RepID=A0A4D6L586_VIGUN|nr:hypothetical protein DEO72_LG2g3982 [Vigna unguiculata]